MTRKHIDYVYRNKNDALRVRVFQRENSRWDYDVFYPSGSIKTYSDEAGDNFANKRAALAEANYQHGPLRPIAAEGGVTDTAWYRKNQHPTHPTRHHATRKTSTQLDREIADALSSQKEVDEGLFYLTDSQERPLGPEFSSRTAAKRAAMKLVREGVHPRVEVWHHWHGGRYMQGLASDEGWSDV